MWNEEYQWHYDYIRLAWDTGFAFEKCKSHNFDRNKICSVDIDRIVKERDVATVDRYISTVVQYILDDDQSKILDINFVKLFKVSQLAVEYLLFCKKYLDNTVVLLKKELAKSKEENKELKVLNDDLQNHLETLTRQQVFMTFKCSACPKAFSSEEFLNAHTKRRHMGVENYNSDTDKLNMEIKELKERLNNTEKLLKEQKEKCPENMFSDMSNGKLQFTEVMEKFEIFKSEVDKELKELRIQKKFYEENYGKLFDIVVTQNKENQFPKNNDDKVLEKTENTTQTEKNLQIENVSVKNVTEIMEVEAPEHNTFNKAEDDQRSELVQPQKDSTEARISTTLAGIESQMHSFWNKLNELQRNQIAASKTCPLGSSLNDAENNKMTTIREVKQTKPQIKPRSKFTQSTEKLRNDTDKLKAAIEQLERPTPSSNKVQLESTERSKFSQKQNTLENSPSKLLKRQSVVECTSEESDTSESEESDSDSFEQAEEQKKSSSPTLIVSPNRKKVTKRSIAKIEASKTPANIEKDIECLVSNRLQELGISGTWSRLPDRSFNKAFEIINHQATFTKKTYRNFNSIKKELIERIGNICKSSKSKNIEDLTIKSPTGRRLQQNIVKISYRPKSGQHNHTSRPTKETVNIKNRALFETDSESDQQFNNRRKPTLSSRFVDPHNQYSDVIEELKGLPKTTVHLSDQISSDEAYKKDAQKGVLKSFPSVGSLSKKKVLFDLKTETNIAGNTPVPQKTGGSTTSIASSILSDKIANDADEKANEKDEKEEAIRVIEKEFEDLSDFDLSV